MKCCYNQCRGNPGCYREEQRNSPETLALREKIALRQDRPRNDNAMLIDRIKGAPPVKSTPESESHPQNPNVK